MHESDCNKLSRLKKLDKCSLRSELSKVDKNLLNTETHVGAKPCIFAVGNFGGENRAAALACIQQPASKCLSTQVAQFACTPAENDNFELL